MRPGRHAVDAIVVGAGPAGATAATLLAEGGLHTVLVDNEVRPVRRLEILPPSARWLADTLDLEPLLNDPAVARPCLGIRRRWSGPGWETDDFLGHPGAVGFVVDRLRLDLLLREKARRAGARMVADRLKQFRRCAGRVSVSLEDGGEQPAAAVFVDATGRPALLARRLGARRVTRERLTAQRLPADGRQGRDALQAAWLVVDRLNGSYWFYEVDGPQGRRERWRVGRRSGGGGESGGPRVDASSACLSQAAGPGWIAVGDAAAAFDPVASQGLSNAFSTALAAAQILLSPAGLDAASAAEYSQAVSAAFDHSESMRQAIYRALEANPMAQKGSSSDLHRIPG